MSDGLCPNCEEEAFIIETQGQAADLREAYRMKPPRAFDAMTKVVLAYRPKAKSKPAKRRKRRARLLQRK